MRIAITGANSSVGKALITRVLTQAVDGLEIRAGVRTREAAEALPTNPAVTPTVIDYADLDSLGSLLEGVNSLIHLAGILIENRDSTYQMANVHVTQMVMEACQASSVGHIVLISALGANAESPNDYYRSKGLAEEIVSHSGIAATIIRTPILLGSGTAGGKALVGMAERRSVKVLGGGQHSLRPLDVDDLSEAVMNCCRMPAGQASVYELVGPQSVTQRELLTAIGRRMGHNVVVGSVPVSLAKLGATLAGWFRRGGMTPTVIDVITANETVCRNADLELGVTLTPLSATLEKLLT